MVDFQSRESRRGYDDTDETEEEEESGQAGDPASSEPEPEDTVDEAGAGEVTDELGVAVVRVNGAVTVEDDRAGAAAIEVLEGEGYEVPTREVVAADFDTVQQNLGGLVVRQDVHAIVTLGGEGVGPDEITVGAARVLFDKTLPGFGELFRTMARESIGTGVVRTRTTAGLVDGVPVFCLPEAEELARLGLTDIVLPELDTLVTESGE